MGNPIKKLLLPSTTTAQNAPILQSNDNKNKGETYTYYGKRMCGLVTGNVKSLAAFLTRVYQTERQRQINDQNEQMRLKQQLQKDLAQVQNLAQQQRAAVVNAEADIKNINEELADLENQLAEARAKDGEENKMAKVKLVLGCVILSILTYYLFVFYSSTFYSAFLLNASELIDAPGGNILGMAVFNTHAVEMAAKDGIGALSFILTGPVIFMGLGFCLHFFMETQGMMKFVKAIGMLLITFMFDCILAYKIGELLYEFVRLGDWGNMPPYSIALALHDVNSWAVIFLGFIVYLIWGIVFDMTMTAYADLRSNIKEINCIKNNIKQARKKLTAQEQKIPMLNAQIDQLSSKANSIGKEISKGVFVNNQLMKTALADFFAGWMVIMPSLSNPSEQAQAQQIYDNSINHFFQ